MELGRIRVQIGNFEKNASAVLQYVGPLREHAHEMAEMQIAGRAHAREDPWFFCERRSHWALIRHTKVAKLPCALDLFAHERTRMLYGHA